MLYRFYNLLLVPFRVLLFLLFGLVLLFFVPFDTFILWPISYLLYNRDEPFFLSYMDWYIDFCFSNWL